MCQSRPPPPPPQFKWQDNTFNCANFSTLCIYTLQELTHHLLTFYFLIYCLFEKNVSPPTNLTIMHCLPFGLSTFFILHPPTFYHVLCPPFNLFSVFNIFRAHLLYCDYCLSTKLPLHLSSRKLLTPVYFYYPRTTFILVITTQPLQIF